MGLGADGLSSSNYGPEESFLSLGTSGHMGVFVALAAAITLSIASGADAIFSFLPGSWLRYKLLVAVPQAPG